MDLAELEALLRSELKGEFSSLTISFNDMNGPNYESVASYMDTVGSRDLANQDWVSDTERDLARKTNSCWSLQWYPETPVGFCFLQASSLSALIDEFRRQALPTSTA